MARLPVITISNAAALNLMNDAGLQSRYPAVRALAQKASAGRGCNCSNKRASKQSEALEAFKTQIVAWPPEMKDWLRNKFNADKLRIFVGQTMHEF